MLIGIPRRHQFWTDEWIPQWLLYSKEELDRVYKQFRLPSSYIFEGEHPDQALERVMHEQLGILRFSKSTPQVLSYSSASDWYPGRFHWDLVLAYDITAPESPRDELPWWREMEFLRKKELRKLDLGWNDDMMRDLQLI